MSVAAVGLVYEEDGQAQLLWRKEREPPWEQRGGWWVWEEELSLAAEELSHSWSETENVERGKEWVWSEGGCDQ